MRILIIILIFFSSCARKGVSQKEQVFIRFIVNEYGGKEINGSITYKCKENELIFRYINFIMMIE